MFKRSPTVIACAALAAALSGSSVLLAANASRTGTVPFATPEGITLVDAVADSEELTFATHVVGRRLGDAEGAAVYIYEKDGGAGKPTCFAECAKQFPPLLADRHAIASGDWSLTSRAEGEQWVFKGQPLYHYAGTERFSSKSHPGWKPALFEPAKYVATPGNIRLQSLEQAQGYGFVSVATGMPLYVLHDTPKVATEWTPLYASDIALPVGDFTTAKNADGTRQWLYKGQRLYTYSGDYSATDINGLTAQKEAQIALAYRFFVPDAIVIGALAMRPPMMTTARGLTVYAETPYHLQYGGRETRGGYHISYGEAKLVGTKGCVDDCTKHWLPVAAPANARGWGFWEVYTRADGSRQWAYKGSALYTYVGDQDKGDINGNNRDSIVWGAVDGSNDDLVALAGGRSASDNRGHLSSYGNGNQSRVFGAGFYWHIVPLF
jgi:predicted lipoprotein with Yx(FWY)xxD motif